MSDILTSPAFQEFLLKRCEEIVTQDETIKKIDSKIWEVEKKLKSTFSKSQLDLFQEYDKLCSDYQTIVGKTIYKQCLVDIGFMNNLGQNWGT